MLAIRKKTLAILLVVVLLLGAALTCLLVRSGIGGSILVTADEYEDLAYFEKTYKKADYMLGFLESHYYVDVDRNALLEGVCYGLAEGLDDPYSEYISAADYQAYMESLLGTEVYCGVGITFLNAPLENGFYALAVNTKGPAYAAGVRKGDIITKINGVDAVEYDGDTLRDMIRGEKDTTVHLGLIRDEKYYEVSLTRADIPAESVVFEMMEGENSDLAYIQISSFIEDTAKDFRTALDKAENAGARGIVIDLRDNGGGLVSTAVGVADELMNSGLVVSAQDHYKKTTTYTTKSGRTELPYVLLVNENTASASEILSAGVQDNKEGKIVGSQTFGKGIIQSFMNMEDGSALKYTALQYFSPSGKQIHTVGITPDVVVELTDDCYNELGFLVRDPQLEKAVEVLRSEVE